MIRKKICMLGGFAVGKTSLVRQFVFSLFEEKYLTTLGVKIDKKSLTVQGQELELMLWDLAGEDEFMKVRMSYLRGSSGYILVADGTRPDTLDTALKLQKGAEQAIGKVPWLLMLNKSDLVDQWRIDEARIDTLRRDGWTVFETSAKSRRGVEQAFTSLATALLEG